MILQKDLTGAGLAKQIIELIESPAELTEMEASARKLAKADAAEVTVDLIEKLAADLRR